MIETKKKKHSEESEPVEAGEVKMYFFLVNMAISWDFYLELFCGAPQEVCNISLLAFAPILGSSPSRSKTIAGSVVNRV